MAQFPYKIKKAVLASPMVDIALPGFIHPLSKYLSRLLSQWYYAKTYAFGSGNYSSKSARFQGNKLCHDPEQFQILHDEIRKNPDLAIGGVTWGWLNAAFESIEILKNEVFLQNIKTPVLILGAQNDAVVSLAAQKKLSRKLAHGDFYCIEGAFHELMFETPRIREKFWSLFDRFMSEESKGF
jgi:lysophospholipase